MQTDSLLTDDDLRSVAELAAGPNRHFANRIARELARLEQENQRLDYDKRGLEECFKACRYERDTTRDALTAARAEVQRLRAELEKERQSLTDARGELSACYEISSEKTAVERREVQRLREELEKLVPDHLANLRESERKALRDACGQLDAMKRENQRLRAEAEKDQSTRGEWQRALDHLEEENARLRNTLRLSLILSEPGQADRVIRRIEKLEGDAGRIALLEGRIQGVTEAAKERLDSHDFRIRALEATKWIDHPVTVATNIVPPASNPFEQDGS